MRPSVLRKRTVSSAEASSVRLSPTALQTSISASNGIGGSVSGAAVAGGIPVAGGATLKAGKSILEQIGTSDHNGWMRKKGDHYNTWKLRYFVLKGSHLYCLRSNSPTVRLSLPSSCHLALSSVSLPLTFVLRITFIRDPGGFVSSTFDP